MLIAQWLKSLIRLPTVCMQTAPLSNGTLNERMQGLCRAAGYARQPNAANAPPKFLSGDDHQSLARNTSAFLSWRYPTHLGFIHFDSPVQQIPTGTHHGPDRKSVV